MFLGALVDWFGKKQGAHVSGCKDEAFTGSRGVSGVGAGEEGAEAQVGGCKMSHCRELKV